MTPELHENAREQVDMAFLRERYLYLLSKLCSQTDNNNCDVRMYEGTFVKCKIKGVDMDFENLIVENLMTPLPGPIDKAILRTSDIISIQFSSNYDSLLKK